MPSSTAYRRRPKSKARAAKVDGIVTLEFERSRALRIVALISIVVAASWLLLVLFAPSPEYRTPQAIEADVRSPEFLRQLEAVRRADWAGYSTGAAQLMGHVRLQERTATFSRFMRSTSSCL